MEKKIATVFLSGQAYHVREDGAPGRLAVSFAGEEQSVPRGSELHAQVLAAGHHVIAAAKMEAPGLSLYYAKDCSGETDDGRTAFVWADSLEGAVRAASSHWLLSDGNEDSVITWAVPTGAPAAPEVVPWEDVACNTQDEYNAPPPSSDLQGLYVPVVGDQVVLTADLFTVAGGDGDKPAAVPAGTRCTVSARRILGAFQGVQFLLAPDLYDAQEFYVDESDLLPNGRYPFAPLTRRSKRGTDD